MFTWSSTWFGEPETKETLAEYYPTHLCFVEEDKEY